MGKIYSYLRFSSRAQELGDSKRRQLAKAHEYCRIRGLTLETTTCEDLGVSTWKGKNITSGQLGNFLRAVDEGLIGRDSTLLDEHLDRVTGKNLCRRRKASSGSSTAGSRWLR